MSASRSPEEEAVEREVAELARVRELFGQMRALAQETRACAVPALQRDSELIIALVEQALELLECIE